MVVFSLRGIFFIVFIILLKSNRELYVLSYGSIFLKRKLFFLFIAIMQRLK